MGRRHKRNRVDATGRNPDKFGRDNAVLIIRRSIWQSPRISTLSPAARALMIELLSIYNGSNNGTLFLSLKDATDRLGFSDWRAAASAFSELETTGLITRTLEGYFDVKTGIHSRARAWRLNWIGDDGERLGPEALPLLVESDLEPKARKRLARRQRALKRYFREHSKRKFAAAESTTLNARSTEITPTPMVETPPLRGRNGGKQGSCQTGETTAHLSYHGDTGAEPAASPLSNGEAARRERLRLAVIGAPISTLSTNTRAAVVQPLSA